jgi:kynurenine formamidase
MDFETNPVGSRKISLNDIARWEAEHGMIPQGAVVALRRTADTKVNINPIAPPAVRGSAMPLPIERDAAQFLSDARYTIGFAVETGIELASDRTLARQLALHGSYVLEGTAPFTSLPATGSLIIVAPAKGKLPGTAPVRVLAMVR